jgi:histidine triad (HIT) family protein
VAFLDIVVDSHYLLFSAFSAKKSIHSPFQIPPLFRKRAHESTLLSMAAHTVFHKILAREIPADIVYEDSDVVVFRDIRPRAPTHFLFVPKVFVASIQEVTKETEDIPGMLILKAKAFAEKHKIAGYKLEFHVGPGGGQEVFYLHLHFLSQQETRGLKGKDR